MRLIESFEVQDEQGNLSSISIYQEVISQSTKDNPNAIRGGLKTAITEDGLHCNRIDNDTYKVVVTGMILKRV